MLENHGHPVLRGPVLHAGLGVIMASIMPGVIMVITTATTMMMIAIMAVIWGEDGQKVRLTRLWFDIG